LSAQGAQDVTRSILAWVADVLPGVPVAAASLDDDAPGAGVKVRLWNIAPKRLTQTLANAQALRLDYVITVRLDDPLEEHRSLGELCLSAMADPAIELDDQLSVSDLLARLNLAPRSGLVVRRHLTREAAADKVERVRVPLEVRLGGLRQLEGVVLGPNDAPVAGARVGVAGQDVETLTDAWGRFRLTAAAIGGAQLTARAHGAACRAACADHGPTILRLPLET
jgi:phosphoribosylcarboxyaminoimidazole (NCAIR) mutase